MDGGIVNEKLFDELIQELKYSVLESTIPKKEYIKLQKFVEKLEKTNFNNNIFKGENFMDKNENTKSYESIICDYMNRILRAIEKKQKPVNITINIESKEDSYSLAEAIIKNLKESGKL
ncbi:TPA: hypothetical protein ACXDAZ_002726 [Clostridium botulinum]